MPLQTSPQPNPPSTNTNGSCSYRAAHPWREACFQRETESWGALQSEELKQTQSVIFTKWHQAPLMKHTLSPSLCPHVRDWMSKLQHPAINISARIVLVSPVLSILFFLTFFPYPSILPISLSLSRSFSPHVGMMLHILAHFLRVRGVYVSFSLVIMLTVFVQLAFLKHRIAVGNTARTMSLHTCALTFGFM